MRNNKQKVITIAALVIAVIGLSIGFAAFASTLNISTSARVTPEDTFSVKFASGITGSNGSFTDFSVTPSTPVTKVASGDAIAGTPSIDNSDVKNPTIGDLSASFTAPGQSVTYRFYVVNDGHYDAYLTNVVFNNASNYNSFKKCLSNASSDNPATQSIVDSVCNNITFTMSIGSRSGITSSETLSSHLLVKNHYEEVIVRIAYEGNAYADGAFTVDFGDIDLHYRTIDEAATSDSAIDDLIPTTAQLTPPASYDTSGKQEYVFGYGDGSILQYTGSQSGGAVQMISGGYFYIWVTNQATATAAAQSGINVTDKKWYRVAYSGGSPDFANLAEYNGPSPIASNTLTVGNQDGQDYIDRVIASFGS